VQTVWRKEEEMVKGWEEEELVVEEG